MPVIDETVITKEIKGFKKEILERLDALEKRLEAVEKGGKGK